MIYPRIPLWRVVFAALLGSCSPAPRGGPPTLPAHPRSLEQAVELDEDVPWRANQEYLESFSDPEAFGVIEEVDGAVWALAGRESEEARRLLESSALEIARIRAERMQDDGWPISVTAELVDTAPSEVGDIRALRTRALQAMRANDLPAAREALSNLVSEVQVTTTRISLRKRAATIERAQRSLAAGKHDETADVLANGFGEIQEDVGTKPLPLVLAEHELALANESADPATFRSRLEAARFQLRRSEELGYAGPDSDYQKIKGAIRAAGRQRQFPPAIHHGKPPLSPSLRQGPSTKTWTALAAHPPHTSDHELRTH